MKITFRGSPDLLKIDDIGEALVDADDSFRRQFFIVILGALRARKIPFRNPIGIKIPTESLDIIEKQTRDFVERSFLEKLGDFKGDLQRTRETASAQPWIQQHYDLEAKLHAYSTEYEKYKKHIEPEIESEVNRLLDDWYRDGSVLVPEAAEWFCKEHDFECTIVESSLAGHGEIVQMLAKWFDRSIDDLPPRLREIAEAYVPEWPELSGAVRRARADEADRRLQAVLDARFEQANNEKEQAKNDPKQVAKELVAWYDVTLDAMTWWGLGSVKPREAAMLLCRFNPHDDKLDPLSIVTDETGPDDYKRLLRVFEDVVPQNRTLAQWQGIAHDRGLKHHSWIDEYEKAVDLLAPAKEEAPTAIPVVVVAPLVRIPVKKNRFETLNKEIEELEEQYGQDWPNHVGKSCLNPVNLSDARCIELAQKPELKLPDWREITGVHHGIVGRYFVTSGGVTFVKWGNEFKRGFTRKEDFDSVAADDEATSLPFPCTPYELLNFIDTARHDLYGFGCPDAFRRAVTNAALLPAVAPSVAPESDEQAAQVSKPADVRCPPRTRIDNLAQAMKVGLVTYRANHCNDPTARALFDWLRENDETEKVVEFDADNDSLTWQRSDGGLADTTFKSFQGRFTNLMRK